MTLPMTIPVVAALLAVDAAPKVWIVDSSPLPNKPALDYRITLRFEFSNGSKGDHTVEMGAASTARDYSHVMGIIFSEKTRPGWKVETVGLLNKFHEAKGKPLRRITAIGEGPKPTVRWEFAPPKKK